MSGNPQASMPSRGTTRVVHITNTERFLRQILFNQLRSIREAGFDTLTISPPGAEVAFIREAGFSHAAVDMDRNFNPLADLITLWRLYRVMRREQYTIVHTHNPKPGLLGQLAARLARVPVVINTVHGFYLNDEMHPAWRRFYVVVEKIAARCSDVILSQNGEDIQTALRESICPPEKIKYLGNGIDLRYFSPGSDRVEARRRKREEIGVPVMAPVVGFVGRLVEEKGLLELFAAARLVRQSMPEAHFVFVGLLESDKSDALRLEDVDKHDIGEVCHFLGLRYDMPEMYGIMDVLVLPSHREGFPRALMEASAMKVPCVATDIRGCREAVEHGKNGLLVPLGDIPALADAILTILGDEARARCMGSEGRRIAEERFNEEHVFSMVTEEYHRLLREKGMSVPAGHYSSMYKQWGKRMLDLVGTAAALLVLSPLLAALAALVRLKLGSPVLFTQDRAGIDTRPFTLFKFRTMTDARDDEGNLLPDGDRLTSLGRFLRSTSLDELPELINVLRGDMSLVGPRPWVRWYLDRYTPEQRRRYNVKPGITGWAQVNGRNAISWGRIFECDLWYVDHVSLSVDLRILAQTFWTLIRREGINQPGHATAGEFTGDLE